MSFTLGYSPHTYAGGVLTEVVLNNSLVPEVASSIERAAIDHLIRISRSFFSGVVMKMTSQSSGTMLEIRGKYSEQLILEQDRPTLLIYLANHDSESLFIGDVFTVWEGNVIYGKLATYNVFFDVFSRNQMELETIVSNVKRMAEGFNRNEEFISKGFISSRYLSTFAREYDVTDKIVQQVSHLDTAVNIRRNQVIFEIKFIYQIHIPKNMVGRAYSPLLMNITVKDEETGGFVVSVLNKKIMFTHQSTFSVG
jgi:hypothetical protein